MPTVNVPLAVTAAAPPPDGTTPDPETAQSPTVTHYQLLADEVSKKLDEIILLIPALEAPHPATANFVRSFLSVPIPFLGTAIAAVDQMEELRAVKKLDIAGGRDTLQFNEAFLPIKDKTALLLDTLSFTLSSRKATLGADALQIYAILKGLARDPGATDAHAHLQNLKRDLGRSGRRKPAAAQQEPPPFIDTAQPEQRKAS
jgi:hypothetical protein